MFDLDDLKPIKIINDVNNRILVKPIYYEQGFSDRPDIYVRKIVYKSLLEAVKHLPLNLGLLIWDGYRCREAQRKLFDWMYLKVKNEKKQLKDLDIYKETTKYMSPASKIGDEYCPPHLSGGAIDLTLYNLEDSKELDMGTMFDDCTEVASAHYYDQLSNPNEKEINIREKRKILRTAMNLSGFTTYKNEWWHFDMGNIFWSREKNLPPVFGPLFGDNEW